MFREELIIGKWEPGEIKQVALLEREAFPSPWTEEMFRHEASSALSRTLVARYGIEEGERTVVGFLVFWLVSDELHIQKIAVMRHFWRRGIATALFAEAVAEATKRHCRHATLEVRRSNSAALLFYERLGFVVEGIRPRYYDDTGEDALILWVNLPDLSRKVEVFHNGERPVV